MEIKAIGIDLAKESFQVYGIDAQNKVVIDKKLNRSNFKVFMSRRPISRIYMEACSGAHYWARLFKSYGHEVKLIAPHRVKPFVGHQKNDRNDARGIVEAGLRPEARFVGAKSLWQQDLQSLHKVRDLKLKHQVALINQIRGLMSEYGVILPKTHSKFKTLMVETLEDGENGLSPLIRDECGRLFKDYLVVSDRINEVEEKIKAIAKESEFVKRAEREVKGVGYLVASRFLASIGDVGAFRNGREVSAWLGLVPRQHSTGGRTRLGRISKHGDSELRKFIVQGARAATIAAMRKKDFDWDHEKIHRLSEQKGFNVASVAVANRNVRRMFAILNKLSVVQ
ncbi:MAG: IS110 family transposase [Bdellovibrionaceae bacterium]|nr:IS110 family transposase [Pseudobdellovibrionaceae bacterium]|tara:strand:+ start:106 stop:1122 length:1017 start_codon:yes stop_codon:yes gene_type:complete